jgi:hypothetical protein
MPIFERKPTLRNEYFLRPCDGYPRNLFSKTSAGCTCDTCERSLTSLHSPRERAKYENKKRQISCSKLRDMLRVIYEKIRNTQGRCH